MRGLPDSGLFVPYGQQLQLAESQWEISVGFRVRVAPGVVIAASSRGVRAGIGPRAGRVPVGAGLATVSSGAGPFTYGFSGTSRRSPAAGTRTPLADLERLTRMAERSQELAQVRHIEQALTSLHRDTFAPAVRTVVPVPERVDVAGVARELQAGSVASISWWRFVDRKAARRAAADRAQCVAAERDAVNAAWHAAAQADADAHWSLLMANDPETVMAALEIAFEVYESPAAAIDCAGASVTILIMFPSTDIVPGAKPAVTPGGQPTLRPRTGTERNQLYLTALASTVLATAKEALAVAPALSEISVVVVRKDGEAPTPGDDLAVIYAGRFPRDRMASLDWQRVDVAVELLLAPDALLSRRGSSKQMVPLDLEDQPGLRVLLQQLHGQL